MAVTKALAEIRMRAQACHSEVQRLEFEAGINWKMDALRAEPPNFIFVYDVGERHSDEHRSAIDCERQSNADGFKRKLRDLYFSVADLELRKALMAKDRQEGEIALEFHQQ